MDGSSAPPLKFDQVEYQTSFEPPEAQAGIGQPPSSPSLADDRWRRSCWSPALALAATGICVGRFYETTNDAYLGADSVTICAQSGGLRRRGRGRRQPDGPRRRRAGPHRSARLPDRRSTARPPTSQNAEATAANIDAQLKEQQATIAQAQAAVDADQAPSPSPSRKPSATAILPAPASAPRSASSRPQSELAQAAPRHARGAARRISTC